MTAPQHTTQPPADAKTEPKANRESGLTASYQLKRCWFVTLGLMGSFGLIASQMNFARAEGDFAVSEYPPEPTNASYSVADATLPVESVLESTFEIAPVSQSAPVPQAFVSAATTPTAVIASFAPEFVPEALPATPSPVAASPAAASPAAASYISPAPAAPQAVALQQAVAPQMAVATPQATPLQLSQQVSQTVARSAPSAAEVPQVVASAPVAAAPAIAPSIEPSIEIEVTPSPAIAPTVSPVAPPTFTTLHKPVAAKATQRRGPIAAWIGASAMAAPISDYVGGAPTQRNAALTLVAMEGGEAPAPEVPDILPEAAPPIVEIAPPVEEVAPPPVQEPVQAPIQATELVPSTLPEGVNLPDEYNSVFVDPTDYSVGATEGPNVVVSEQSTGCEFTVGQGQAVPNGACGTAASAAPAAGAVGQAPVANAPAPVQSAPVASSTAASGPAVNVGPVSFSASGIRFGGSTTAAGREYLNRSIRPLVNLQAAGQFIFPLSIPAPITSLFGFRIHPITGDQRFHAGTDIGAPQGTPVLAIQDGVVESADYAGGYGMMVVLRHQSDDNQLQSRYAHLSEILVEPGKDVRRGEVIGLVGSTGNSTGPHLHFEMLQATADGWVLVNPDGLIQQSLASLVNALNDPMQVASFSLADLNLGALRTAPNMARPGSLPSSTIELPSLPGQNGISFRPAQPNAS
jgi:murein DD-endopeptidase MepM/ murein hydrolase activator NlpD